MNEAYLSVPAYFFASAYNKWVDMSWAYVLWMLQFCTLQRSLKQIILDDNDDRREFADIKREEMEYEARMEAQEYEKDDMFDTLNLQDND